MKFSIKHKSGKARAGVLSTDHGDILTPIFMPVGTLGAVKGVTFDVLQNDINAQIILGNTYHLYLRPGAEILKQAGGLHGFNGWKRPILTDSGGYQVYSLSKIRKITEEGVVFQSHIDGSKHKFTPENVMDMQRIIGADIMMAFDECTPYPAERDYAHKSMLLTHKWLERCYTHFHKTKPLYGHEQGLFPIVQGSVYEDLREQSAKFISQFDSPGYAIGGLSVGEPTEMMYKITEQVCDILPHDKPRYLMGVGTPANIIRGIAHGIDMFDCVMPTRNGRNAMLFTRNGIMNMRNKKWEDDFSPIDESSPLGIDKTTSKSYMRHLFVAGEMLGPILASIHNLAFYLRLVAEARQAVIEGNYETWAAEAEKQTMTRL
ncbi:MAG: tRNA guanosine(34) transglycosylase Tgt [Bacteroidetes bacterium GWF2_43_63]|nr:MAG: tRNA guanosine(34) transglycosylase Tgt [Bacteroidetes bacterium GWE2_42_42]OFY54474.1 MAG: tRNA guanosine(34) transglycosylase Tgt [Bacteroidetes bacterium GWF2_43_63]HBG70422.1 tRNA guanosine(34) transglycosylase Tgt [Bacteroidales bacterium]HCB63461.1 tRNA guanosine(34) transglycosylase Tgt [Bacteroidales bacterium]